MQPTKKDWEEWVKNMLAKNPELTKKDIEAIFIWDGEATKSAMWGGTDPLYIKSKKRGQVCVPKTLEEVTCIIEDLDFPKEGE